MIAHQPRETGRSWAARPHRASGAFTIVEVLMALLVLLASYVTITQSFVLMNARAAASRLGTDARVVVERNVAEALSVPFSSTSIPAILAVTSATGSTYDDDANGDGMVNLMAQDSSGAVQVKGVLTRTVTAVANPENADIRRVTFRVDYTYRKRNYAYQMTTVRSRS